MEPLTLKSNPGSTPISFEDAERFFGKEALETRERRFEIETVGPWAIVSKVTGLCETVERDARGRTVSSTLYGDRTLQRPMQSGYAMEGRVSLNGRKVRAFTSSTLFELPDGRLIDVAVLYACV